MAVLFNFNRKKSYNFFVTFIDFEEHLSYNGHIDQSQGGIIMAAINSIQPNAATLTPDANKKRSKVLLIILLVLFIAALLFFGISLCKALPHTTNEYYYKLISKFEVDSPHNTAVTSAKEYISSLRMKAVIDGVVSAFSFIGSVFCIFALKKKNNAD
ncbi:hypothetical protein [Ruminococcus sp.]|uniref:hypothetical protein n=1 Tax=Ruminococcus sp. TaxID=41978 RepID=UPI0025CE4E64|nr:hypothetical protein [Ruminococcus sp.]MCR4637718.1 hypothetical protein [Ruminococcus sp.]